MLRICQNEILVKQNAKLKLISFAFCFMPNQIQKLDLCGFGVLIVFRGIADQALRNEDDASY